MNKNIKILIVWSLIAIIGAGSWFFYSRNTDSNRNLPKKGEAIELKTIEMEPIVPNVILKR